jgi:hypothetical protein
MAGRENVQLLDEAPPSLDAIAWTELRVAPGGQGGAALRDAVASLGLVCGSPERAVKRALCHPLMVPDAARVLAPWLIASAASRRTKDAAGAMRVLAQLAAGAPELVFVNSPLHPDIVATRAELAGTIAAAWSAWAARLRDRNVRTRGAAAWLLGVLPGRDADTLALFAELLDAPATKGAFRAQLVLSAAAIARRSGADVVARLVLAFEHGDMLERTAGAVALVACGRVREREGVWDHLRLVPSMVQGPGDDEKLELPWEPNLLAHQAMAAQLLRGARTRGVEAVAALVGGKSLRFVSAVVRAIGLGHFAARGRTLPAGPSPQLFDDERALLGVLVPAVVKHAPVNVNLARDLLPDETDVLAQMWQRLR